ncbi:multicopper oxidase family protein [Nodosilinea sp. LEGE 07298]|uniref:multicopper oxidase family protein n=1 Tax=Nodosilinea sp. LEGE 07298 TaxID=2777970 RepID=UPI00187E6A96|nr:multicopper oxidase family protein [Nodosilinea sp. LEGE 07298]MBE9108199.1 multicopper oxidase family protein [Nodosilinea sp. LEGE 07298]
MKRRHFIALGAAGIGSAATLHWAGNRPVADGFSAIAAPTIYTSQDGLLEVDLTAAVSPVQVGDRTANLLSYNSQSPGPRLEARPGDTVRIRLHNQLDQPTNLHYHGLHITPEGTGDNVFVSVAPGETFTYEFTIPADHPAGTFWYHPHHHHHAAEQLFGGLAGLFVIRGELDEIPEVKAAQEEFIVLRDYEIDRAGNVPPADHMALMMGREGSLVTVNGQLNPSLSVPQGGLLRLRLLNASASRFYKLQLEGHPFQLIATDGGAIASPVQIQELLLAPGERAEVLVQGNRQPDTYRLLNLPYNRNGIGMMGGMGGMMGGGHGMGGMMHGGRGSSGDAQPLATLAYSGSVAALPLPRQLGTVETLPEPTVTRRIELSMTMGHGMGQGMGMEFWFNGQPYDEKRIDIEAQLGTVEEWELANVDPDLMDHPFHLHVNPFQVVSRSGQPEPYRAWKDTVLVKGGETVRIRVPFRTFAGKTVYHCHILDHEDLGMMGNLQISA